MKQEWLYKIIKQNKSPFSISQNHLGYSDFH